MNCALHSLGKALVLTFIVCTAARGQSPAPVTSVPTQWDPGVWEIMLVDIAQAQKRGARLQAEALCARAIPYVEAQGLQALRDYASFLDAQKPGSGDAMRSKADRLAQTKAAQASGGQAGSVYLGFAPADELDAFAAALRQDGAEPKAQAMAKLAAGYRRGQQAYFKRGQLMQAGKDPRGEC